MNFEVKIKIERTMEDGSRKMVSEEYLIKNAVSFGEVEDLIVEESKPRGEFKITAIKISNYAETCLTHGGKLFFGCKVINIIIDERTGKEKHSSQMILVSADDIDEAKTYLDEHMKGTMIDYKVDTIKETKILDVYEAK